jgi:hypothetical protein
MNQPLLKLNFDTDSHPGDRMHQSAYELIMQGLAAIFLLIVLTWAPFSQANPADRSDLNNDYSVDTLDLEIFSNRYLEQDWQSVDWCRFYESSIGNERYFRKITSDKTARYNSLLEFIAYSYNCQVTIQSSDKSDLNNDLVIVG